MNTERIAYRAEGANVYRQDGALVCIAVDPLDAEVIAGMLQWKVTVHEPTPEPEPRVALIEEWLAEASRYGHNDALDLLARLDACASAAPLTNAVPDPFPTADMVAAEGRLWTRHDTINGRWYYANNDDAMRYDDHPFISNPVSVKVVAAAEWENLLLAHGHYRADRVAAEYVLRRVDKAIAATDALGLDA